jgi:hypothetical protein
VLAAWVAPLTVPVGISVVTAGFGALTIVVAIMTGPVSTRAAPLGAWRSTITASPGV